MKFAINEFNSIGQQLTDLRPLTSLTLEDAEAEAQSACRALVREGFHVQLVQLADRGKGAPAADQADRWLATYRNRSGEVCLEASR